MLATERVEFDTALASLCAGFDLPATQARQDAYWRGLANMGLLTFQRCVDYALSEQGTRKLPTVPALWQISRKLRYTGARPAQNESPPDARDKFERFADQLMLNFLMRQPPTALACVPQMIAAKQRIAQQYALIAAEDGDVTGKEIRDSLHAAWLRVWVQAAAEEIEANRHRMFGHLNASAAGMNPSGTGEHP